MSLATVLFSSFVGFLAVMLFPCVSMWIYADTVTYSDRRSRLDVLRWTVLISTTALALWSYWWVVPCGQGVALSAESLAVFVFFGTLFLAVTTPLELRLKKAARS